MLKRCDALLIIYNIGACMVILRYIYVELFHISISSDFNLFINANTFPFSYTSIDAHKIVNVKYRITDTFYIALNYSYTYDNKDKSYVLQILIKYK